MVTHIDYYFDYLSGYAFFAWLGLRRLTSQYQVALRPHPVVFGALLDHWGNLGPAEIPPKRAFVYRHGFRTAATLGVTFDPPRRHPFNPLAALRLSLGEVAGEKQADLIDAIFRAAWTRGDDVSDLAVLGAALEKAGLAPETIERVHEPEIKAALRRNTEQAISRGTFGVPTMFVNDELFWGADQLPFIEELLQGKDLLDRAAVERMLAQPRAIDRRKLSTQSRR